MPEKGGDTRRSVSRMLSNTQAKETKTNRSLKTSWLQSYLEYTKNQESPEIFHLWVGITLISGALRRRVWLDRSYFKLYPNIYTILVSPTGTCRKSTSVDLGIEFLRKVDGMQILSGKMTPEGFLRQLSETPMEQAETKKKDALIREVLQQLTKAKPNIKEDNESKEKKKTESETTTNEKKNTEKGKSGEGDKKTIYVRNCISFVHSSELRTLLGSASYSESLATLLTDLYGCGSSQYITRTYGKVGIDNPYITFLGASNPEWLAKGFDEDSFGGGFMGRIIFIYQSKGRRVSWPELTSEQVNIKGLLELDLQRISRLSGKFSVSRKAYDFFKEWYENFQPDFSTRMAGYYERKHDHLLKLAMVLAISEGDELILRLQHLTLAMKLLDQAETVMPDAFAYVGATNEARISQHIIESVRGSGGAISVQQCIRGVRHQIRNKREFDGILDMLIESGILLLVQQKKDGVRYIVLTAEFSKEKKKKGQKKS